jgi:catechol 2,3-dioxygenase-like lactoylglutathione lyase family enzyme
MSQVITGIQQVGIGVSNAHEAWKWYRDVFDIDVPVFDDEAKATLMKDYTGGEIHSRRAVLALNMLGGGGFEIWQFKSRTPSPCEFDLQIGDLGINAVKIKSRNVEACHKSFQDKNINPLSELHTDQEGNLSFWVEDPFHNKFQIVSDDSWFSSRKKNVGGVCGVVMGVKDIDKVLPLYKEALGFNRLCYDESGQFDDLKNGCSYRRVLIEKKQKDEGPFSRLLGGVQVELVEMLDQEPKSVFKNRYWGDLGFIHVCFDVNDMDRLESNCEKLGYSFTVDSADSFDMGEAAGRFSYIEDPDGTLIEFVQTHKIPIMKKWGWFINLKKRNTDKPLPNWMLRSMALNRVK